MQIHTYSEACLSSPGSAAFHGGAVPLGWCSAAVEGVATGAIRLLTFLREHQPHRSKSGTEPKGTKHG